MPGSPSIRSVTSEHTWATVGTTDDTVIAGNNNKNNNNVRNHLSGGKASQVHPFQPTTTATTSAGAGARGGSLDAHASSQSKSRDGSTFLPMSITSGSCSGSVDNSLFDLGDDDEVIGSMCSGSHGGSRSISTRSNKDVSDKMKDALIKGVRNSSGRNSIDGSVNGGNGSGNGNKCGDLTAFMSYLFCLGNDPLATGTSSSICGEERESSVTSRDGKDKTLDGDGRRQGNSTSRSSNGSSSNGNGNGNGNVNSKNMKMKVNTKNGKHHSGSNNAQEAGDDALVLERALKESNASSPRRERERLRKKMGVGKMIQEDEKLGSLDIVMELQQAELSHSHTGTDLDTSSGLYRSNSYTNILRKDSFSKSKQNGNGNGNGTANGLVASKKLSKPRNLANSNRGNSIGNSAKGSSSQRGISVGSTSKRTKKTKKAASDRTLSRESRAAAAAEKAELLMDDVATDIGGIITRSASSEDMFRFQHGRNKNIQPAGAGAGAGANSSSTNTSKKNCIHGPPLGSFQNIANENNAIHSETVNTYTKYRADPRSTDMVLKRVKCSVPLYHQSEVNQQIEMIKTLSSDSDADGLLDSIPADIKHVCSEPASKSFQVRGRSYLTDGAKVPSDESMFALLGVDSVVKKSEGDDYRACDVSKSPNSYFHRLRAANKRLGLDTPFLFVINFVVPWGNLVAYFYRPDGENGRPFNGKRKGTPSEKLWDNFLRGDKSFRNGSLKFIPYVVEGPWAVRKIVGSTPAMIGQKIPTSYHGSLDEGYLEICMNVTKGGKMANSICSAVASKASIITIDLAFLLQGSKDDELPEQLLSVFRLHHVRLKKSVVP